MKKLPLFAIMSLISTVSFAGNVQKLSCLSRTVNISAEMQGYNLTKVQIDTAKNITTLKNTQTSSDSFDMYQSTKFNPVSPYPVYNLGKIDNANLLLALPGGDMRDDHFTALLFTNGSAMSQEIELNCTSKSI